MLPKGAIPPLAMDLEVSGMILSSSRALISPNPLQAVQAPYGELKENKLGSGSG